MTRSDRIALILSLVGVLVSWIVADRVFERMAHLEDEMAYVWQAQAIAQGHLILPTPPEPKSFLAPFVVDYQGKRTGKYPLGWPALLGIAVFLHIRSLINPLLAGLGVWLTYILGKRVFNPLTGLLAAGLTVTSPFFMMVSGSLLSHTFGYVLSLAFVLAWLDVFIDHSSPWPWLPVLVSAGSLGLLGLTRPLTALAIAVPFGFHGLYLLVRGDGPTRKRLLLFGVIALALLSLHFLWQYAVTGNPFMNPYELWWPYDKIGFGPGVGRIPGGHTLNQAIINTKFSFYTGIYDLFGWGSYSWIFLPVGLLATLQLFWQKGIARQKAFEAVLVSSVFVSLVVFYLAYWIGSSLYGPRYYYEGLYSLTLISGAGIAYLAGWPIFADLGSDAISKSRGGHWRPLTVTFVLGVLVGINLCLYVPIRVGGMHGLYGIQRSMLKPFTSAEAQKLTPALVIVHPYKEWTEYGGLLELQDPFLNTPFVFVYTRGSEADARVAALYPNRGIYYYYTDDPYVLYTGERVFAP